MIALIAGFAKRGYPLKAAIKSSDSVGTKWQVWVSKALAIVNIILPSRSWIVADIGS